jgi:flagellar motor switch protein FliN/FliY
MSDEQDAVVDQEAPPEPAAAPEADQPGEQEVPFKDLSATAGAAAGLAEDNDAGVDADGNSHTAADLEVVFDVPVKVSAILGQAHMEVSELLNVGKGTVLELDRKVGEAIDIHVNNRLVARGEVVLVDDRLGITMTEIIKTDRS